MATRASYRRDTAGLEHLPGRQPQLDGLGQTVCLPMPTDLGARVGALTQTVPAQVMRPSVAR